MTRQVVVDGHAHVFRPAAVSARGVDALAPADRDAPAGMLLDAMADAGVDRAVLVPLDTADDYVAEVLAGHPGRFAAVAVAGDAELGRVAGQDGVRALLRRREAFPFEAVRTTWLGEPGEPITSSPAFPMLEHLDAEGLILWSYLPPDQQPLLRPLLERLPGLRVVLNHLGFCPQDMRVDDAGRPRFRDPLIPRDVLDLARFPGVHVMISGQYALSVEDPPYADLFGWTTELGEAFGPARMMWASDFPWVAAKPGYTQTSGLVRALPGLSAAERDLVLGGTALSLFGSLDPSPKET